MSFKTFHTNQKTGITSVDPIKRYSRSRWFMPDNQANLAATPWIIALAAGGNSGQIPINFDASQGHAELFGAVLQATGAFTIRVYDPGRSYYWSNRPLHDNTVFGTAQLPYYFPETYFIPVEESSKQLMVELTDLSGAPNNVRMAFFGRTFKHKDAPRAVSEEYFRRLGGRLVPPNNEKAVTPDNVLFASERSRLQFITTDQPITALAAGANVWTEFIVPTDFGFEVSKLTAQTVAAANAFEFELTESRNGERLHQEGLRVHGAMGWGVGTLPYVLPETIVLPKKYRLRMQVWNIAVGGAANFFFTMAGRQVRMDVPSDK